MNRLLAAAVAALAAAAPAHAAGWVVASDASSIGFVSIKNGDTAEVHEFGALTGEVMDDGAAVVAISLASVDTRVDIRNERMREVLFKVGEFPLATVRAEVDLAAFEALSVGDRAATEAELTVSANGAEAGYDAVLNVTRIGEDRVAVSAAEPIVIEAADFGYEVGLEMLREIAGLDSIAPVVPVTFDIVLTR